MSSALTVMQKQQIDGKNAHTARKRDRVSAREGFRQGERVRERDIDRKRAKESARENLSGQSLSVQAQYGSIDHRYIQFRVIAVCILVSSNLCEKMLSNWNIFSFHIRCTKRTSEIDIFFSSFGSLQFHCIYGELCKERWKSLIALLIPNKNLNLTLIIWNLW